MAGAGEQDEHAPASDAPDRLDRRAGLIGAFVLLWLAVQVGVPMVQLVDRGSRPRPREFAWQMFSHRLERPAERFTITTANGTREVDVRPLLSGPMRREVRYAPAVVAALCERPEIQAVRVDDVERGTSETTCR